jgi:hypothetical protein
MMGLEARTYLHDGVGGEHFLLDVGLGVGLGSPDQCKEPHGVLGRHRLAGPRLSTHDDRLVLIKSEINEESFTVNVFLFVAF